ncbi:MAG: transglycosylase SLT domain-containing protein [Aquificaceae bacterium]
MPVLLLLFTLLYAWAQLPKEYELLLQFKRTSDPSIAYKILRDYPDAVFKDDLMLLLARLEKSKGKEEEVKKLLKDINPRNLSSEYRDDYVRLWKESGLDPKEGFLKHPVLFREFVPQLRLGPEEALHASEELFRRRYYREVVSLLEPLELSKVCYMLGKSYLYLRERERAVDIFERCEDERAKADLAVLYFELGQREQSEKVLSTLQDRGLLSDALFRIGRQCLTGGNYRCAVEHFLRMEPSYKKEFNLGLSYYALGDYSKALDSFLRSLAFSKDKEEKSASYFWAYKSAFMIDRESANEYLIKASNGNGFYYAVASAMLGLPVASKAIRVVMEDENLPKTASVIRAIWLAGFPEYARLEAFKRIREMSSSDILAISKLDTYLAIRLALRKYGYGSLVYSAVAFPRPFWKSVERSSNIYGISPALIYAVMRQESLFDTYAVSVAGAKGLMQLLDSTAQHMARKERVEIKNLFEPETNIRLGTAYLRYLFDMWNGDLVRALASYNAGPSRVKSWNTTEDAYLFIETIPIAETRNYVKRVLYNYYVYSELLK